MMLKGQALLLLPSIVLSAAIDNAASKCATGSFPAPSVYGASILSLDAVARLSGPHPLIFAMLRSPTRTQDRMISSKSGLVYPAYGMEDFKV